MLLSKLHATPRQLQLVPAHDVRLPSPLSCLSGTKAKPPPEERPTYQRKSRYGLYTRLLRLNSRSSQRTVSEHSRPTSALSAPSSQVAAQLGNPALGQARGRPPLFAAISDSTVSVSGAGELSSMVTRAHPHIPGKDPLPTILRAIPLATVPSPTIIPAHTSAILALAVSPDGVSFASTSKDRHTGVWDAKSGECLQLFEGHRHYVHAVAYSSDGISLATGSRDERIVVRRLDGRSEDKVLTGHEDRVSAVAFSPDGTIIVSGSWDQSVRMWKATTGHSIWTKFTHSGPVMGTNFSPDGSMVASASTDMTVRLWDSRTGEAVGRLCGHEDQVYGVVWAPDGTRLASCSRDRTVAIWDLRGDEPPLIMTGHADVVTSVVWVADSEDVLSASNDRTVRRWDSVTGQLLAVYAGHISPVLCLAVLPNGQTIVSGCDDGSLRVWDARSRTVVSQNSDKAGRISFVRKSPDGIVFAACTISGDIEVLETSTGRRVASFKASESPSGLSFSDDGSKLVASYPDGGHDDWLAKRDFAVPQSPETTPPDISFFADADGWLFASCLGCPSPRRLLSIPEHQRWSDWSSQVASAGAVIAFGSESGVLTVMDFTHVMTQPL
jgi:WD40 repeat protein